MAIAESSSSSRTARVEARIAPEVLDLVRRAAELQGRSVSDFLVSAALKDAQKTLEEASLLRLCAEDQQAFAELLLNPPAPTPAMKRAVAAHDELIARAG
ncbi:MAG: hypothetical protein RL722_818 [Pseudomonadota bacterium]|jgi:uncharacterized protein (DUF1778 family)